MKILKTMALAALVLSTGGCDNKAEREAEIEAARQVAIDSVNAITARERMIDSMNRSGIEQPSITVLPPDGKPESPNKSTPRTKKEEKTEGTAKTPDAGTGGREEAGKPSTVAPQPENSGTQPGTETAGTEGEGGNSGEAGEEPKKKKGVSNAVKGAVIGAGAGAVGGAIINKKNRGKGAVIGGVIGAGAGAATGIILDRNKKKKDTTARQSTTKDPGATTN